MEFAFAREGSIGPARWRQVHLVSDGHVETLNLEPALLGGWRGRSFETTGPESWGDSDAAAIADWIRANWDRPGATFAVCDVAETRDLFARVKARMAEEHGGAS